MHVEIPLTIFEKLRKMSNELRCSRRSEDEKEEEKKTSLIRWKSEQQMSSFSDHLSHMNHLIVGIPIVVGNQQHENNNKLVDRKIGVGKAAPQNSLQYLAFDNWRNLSKSDSHVNETKFDSFKCSGLTKSLSEVLDEDLTVDKANKLKKRMYNTLIKFHTADLSTLFAFLKLNRYALVREEIKEVLCDFTEQDLNMKIIS